MKHFLILALVAAVGCGEKQDHGHDGHDHDHSDEAKHGGEIVELSQKAGEDFGHMEVKIDHDAGQITVWASTPPKDEEMKMDKPPVFNCVINDKPIQITGEKKGATWVFRHAALKGEPESARFVIKTAGKTFTPKWEHHHH